MSSADQAEIPPGGLEELGAQVGTYLDGAQDGRGLRIALACSLFNGGITYRLAKGALRGLEQSSVEREAVTMAWAPGAFELPLLAQKFATSGSFEAVVCLGAVIRGETGHYELVAGECAAGIARVQLDTGIPVIFGVLTTETLAQALERSLPDDSNKGLEAALAAVRMVRLLGSEKI